MSVRKKAGIVSTSNMAIENIGSENPYIDAEVDC